MSPTVHNGRPVPIQVLLPHAQALADELGEVPSQNRIQAEFKVGVQKARQLRRALVDLRTGRPVPVPDEPDTDSTTADESTEEHASPQVADAAAPADIGQPEPARTPVPPVPVETARSGYRVRSWPVLLLALPAFVAIWSGWVGLGELAGFGVVHPLPGIADRVRINTAITLPIGVETYAAYALHVWLAGVAGPSARRFAKWSAIGSLLLGMAGQGAYHLMTASGITHAPWPVVTAVSCLPVAVLGMGAALAHLIRDTNHINESTTTNQADRG